MQSILESLNDPHARHAIMVHLPIAASVIGVGLLVLLAVFRFKPIELRLAVSGLYIAATIGALLASNSGEAAEENVERSVPALSAVEESAEEHEEMGIGVALVARPDGSVDWDVCTETWCACDGRLDLRAGAGALLGGWGGLGIWAAS